MVHTGAARAAVENMMRTLSVEWARFGVRLVAVAVGQFDTETLRTKYPRAIVEGVAGTVPRPAGDRGGDGLADRLSRLARRGLLPGCVITIDGAPRQLVRPLAPGGATEEAGRADRRGALGSTSR